MKQLGHCISLTLLTGNASRAASLYGAVLGGVWTIAPSGVITAGSVKVGKITGPASTGSGGGGGGVGGGGGGGGGAPGWVPTFAVREGNVESAVNCAVAHGATREAAAAAPSAGDAVHLRDGQGARFALRSPAAAGDADWAVRPAPGAPSWFDMLADAGGEAAAADFYRAVLGWRGIALPAFPGGAYHVMFSGQGVVNADKTCGVLTRKLLAPKAVGALWLPFFEPGSDAGVAAAAAAAPAVGAEVVVPPMMTPDGRFTILRDTVEDVYFAVYNRTDAWGDVRKYDTAAH
jgi:predicted enzyme related to lactoylglutathione lyase